MSSLIENIDTLKQAQGLDRQIYLSTQALAEDIPEERSKIKRQLEGEKARLKELEESLQKTQLKQKEKEGESRWPSGYFYSLW